MSNNKGQVLVPEYLKSTYQMILEAFPQGVPEGQYLPLLNVLSTKMSLRVIAELMTMLTAKTYHEALHDAMTANAEQPSELEIARVRQDLMDAGFEKWFDEPW